MEKFVKKEKTLAKKTDNKSFVGIFFMIFLTVIILNVQNSYSQGVNKIIFDSKGTDFWMAFPPNFHNYNNSNIPELKNGDSLYLFIVADEPSTGRIEYKDRDGNFYFQDFSITDPSKIYTFKVSYRDFEVTGFNESGNILSRNDPNNQCEVVGINAFHITSDNEVTVYAHSQAVTTSEAFLVLPTDVLGMEYIVLSYNSHGSTDWTGNVDPQSTPSQFLIVATEDGTNVNIISNTEFYRNGKSPINVTLNKGEVFLVQAKITTANTRADLTGTEVLSDKPVAVFSGHQRTILPISENSFTSRDCLIEQMLPVKTWGKNAFIVPYVLPADATKTGDDLYRILFSEDKTDLYINGYYEGRFNRGEYYEQAINGPLSLEASQAILVAQYKKTSQGNGQGSQPDSDPFMMLVPPKEQFMDEYNVINTQAYEAELSFGNPTGKYDKVYNDHYIAVVVHKDDLITTSVNNINLTANQYKPIPSSDYYYANVQVSEGAHKVKSTGRIGVYVYGYGYANSYGYVGGLSMMEFDFKKPKLQTIDSCYKLEGMAFDSSSTDSKLKTLTTDDSRNINVKVDIEKFSIVKDSAYFKAQLLNKYADGVFVVTAVDSVGLDSTRVYDIAGFTVALDSIGSRDSIIYFQKEYRTHKVFCEYFNLQNYGKFDHNITNMYFKNNSNIKLNLPAPFIIKSKEEIPLGICFSYESDTLITDTLYIEDDCGDRALLVINLKFTKDNDDPKVTVTNDSCFREFNVNITEDKISDWGLKKVEIIAVENCKVSAIVNAEFLAEYRIDILDSFKDAIFYIEAEDSLGHSVMRYDTVQGFTLEFPQFESKLNLMQYSLEKISSIKCDTLVLGNSGLLPFTVKNIYLKHNINYSIPKSYFPMIINPGDKRELIVCFQPTNIYEVFRDTMVISFNCLDKYIALEGEGDSLIHYGDADCGVVIKTVSFEIEPKYFLERVVPNPVMSTTTFHFQLAEPSFTSLEIYDLTGNIKMKLINTHLEKGEYKVDYDLSELSQGVYIYIIKTSNKVLRGQFIKM